MNSTSPPKCRVLCIYYSLSSQSKNLVQALAAGIHQSGGTVTFEPLTPVSPLRYPVGSYGKALLMMVSTFFRVKTPIQPLSEQCHEQYDLILLAGPTWSYNPSGPVLALLYGGETDFFSGRKVVPVISCRSYWKLHFRFLKNKLERSGADVINCIAFMHPGKEPWRTIGVFLKLAGRVPEKHPLFSGHYRKFGHTREQLAEAESIGGLLAEAVIDREDISALAFHSPTTGNLSR